MNSTGTLYFLIGKMGAGKTTFAAKFAAEIGAILISKDEWLGNLYPDEILNLDDFVARHHKLLNVLGPHVQKILTSGSSVVLDFPANTSDTSLLYMDIANAVNAKH